MRSTPISADVRPISARIALCRLALASLISIWAVFFASASQAHVRWFVDTENPGIENFQPWSFSNFEVQGWIGIAVVLIAISILLDNRLPKVPVVNTQLRHDAMELMRILVGMSLLLTAYEGALIAPHMEAYGGLGTILVYLQALIGILLISNRFLQYAAISIMVLYLGVLAQFGFIMALEYINVIGIALFLLFNYMPNEKLRARFKPYSVDALRIFTGIALVTLGVTEKLTGAIWGEAFLADNPWNFLQAWGFEFFTDHFFVLSAGVMEVVFGTIMILGTVTRLNTLVLSCFLLLSNITFLVQDKNDEALTELIGHMPIIATAVILITLGYGQRLKVSIPFGKRTPSV